MPRDRTQQQKQRRIEGLSMLVPRPWASRMKNGLSHLRLAILRVTKNFRSNRFWILWGGTLYVPVVPPPSHLTGLPKSFRLYVRWSGYFLRGKPVKSKTAIFVTELGMFGNMTRRLANGLSLASLEGYGSIVIPHRVIFQGDVFREGVHRNDDFPTVYLGAEPRASSNPLDFLIDVNLFEDLGIGHGGPKREVDRAWEVLHAMLLKTSVPRNPNNKGLTVHLRGGDVFGPRKPRAYGQPPLSFYELVLNNDEWEEVTIVHQDLLNPVLPELVRLCEQRGIRPRLVSGSLADDISVLLESFCLVAGRGTFVPAIAGLSRLCRKLYFFEDKCNLVPRRSGIEVVRVVDSVGTYRQKLLSRNWEDTPQQRDMMLSYPLSSLAWESS